MKTLKIYSTITTIAIIVLSIFLFNANSKLNQVEIDLIKKNIKLQQKEKNLLETEKVLQQYSDRYYKEIGKQ